MKVSIGTPVVYQQGIDDTPYGYRVGAGSRQHPALICYIYANGTVYLVTFAFGYYQHIYVQQVKRGEPSTQERCWYLPSAADSEG